MADTQEWHYSQGDQKYGPIPTAELKEMASSGDLSPADLIWKEGWPQWKQANSVKGLFSAGSTGTAPPVPPPLAAAAENASLDNTSPTAGTASFRIAAMPSGLAPISPTVDKWIRRIATDVAGVGKWICIVFAGLFGFAAVTAEMAPGGAHAAGVACFFGILARLCQAEQMHRNHLK
jgi:hypothetical protein